ncbi:MAG: glycosyltransferase family 4 protein [Candidatus Sericytochromatia bacterium]|nr:glycosyltransferase family 4 protein [Candidatus Sericytochromatia bacterium]
MTRVLVATDGLLGPRMTGPAIRALELSRVLAGDGHEVVLASTHSGTRPPDAPESLRLVHGCHGRTLTTLAAEAEVVVTGGFVAAHHPGLVSRARHLVLDLYDPMLLEVLASAESGTMRRWRLMEQRAWLAWQMARADAFLVASDRQRDYWTGRACALGLLSAEHHDTDSGFDRLFLEVPFGIPEIAPDPGTDRVMRGRIPGVGKQDVVALWYGGLWDWFDPLTPLRGAAALADDHPELKLVFLAGKPPQAGSPRHRRLEELRTEAARLGTLGNQVVLVEDWVPYAERGRWLLEADAGVSAHRLNLETRFSYRTRLLDFLWAGLPILTTEGDGFAERVARADLGWVLPEGDASAWTRALADLAGDVSLRRAKAARVAAEASGHRWSQASGPLRAYVSGPWQRRDRKTVWPPPLPRWAGWPVKGLIRAFGY